MKHTNEIWKPIPTYEGLYECSDTGKIRSLDRRVPGKAGCIQTKKGTERKPSTSKGYPTVILFRGGIRKAHLIHRLVASAFLPNKANQQEVNHIDGCKTNNNVSNLEWCSASYNRQHAYDTGLKVGTTGSRNGMSKLSEADIPDIRRMLARGDTQASIAKHYGINSSNISYINQGKTWTHV